MPTNLFITILLLGLMLSCSSTSENKSDPTVISEVSIEALEKTGFEKYQESPTTTLAIFKRVAIEYEKAENFEKAGFTNLNIANIFDEHLNQIDSALIFSEKSLSIWEAKKDSMQIANLLKYIGLLKGRTGQFEEAKSTIQRAIKLYQDQGFEQGIAVSEINLANVYLQEQDYESSEKYFRQSKRFWLNTNNRSRVYTDNILGIKIYHAVNNDNMIQGLIEENRNIEQEIKVNEFMKTKFNELIQALNK